MRVRFWGTRGSIAVPGPDTLRYGGNTSCVELRSAQGTLVVLDCGTGARALGESLAADPSAPSRGRMLITHTHWDHIQGFPFFEPFFDAQQRWDVYGPRDLGSSIRETLATQMQYRYFPIAPEQFAAEVAYHDLSEGEFEIDDIHVTARYMNHPALTLGYRFEVDGATVVYATDHEPHGAQRGQGEMPRLADDDAAHLDFISGADLLIHDAQYTEAEYASHSGWGHSAAEFVVDSAAAAGVRHVVLFHHDPTRDDLALDDVLEAARARPACVAASLEVSAAAEGWWVDLGSTVRRPASGARDADRAESAFGAVSAAPLPTRQPVLIGMTDEGLADEIVRSLRADRLNAERVRSGEALRQAVQGRQPALVLLERDLGGEDALELCRGLREGEGALSTEIPIVVVTDDPKEVDSRGGAAAGVTDWLVAPFKSTYLRARVRCWLLRTACHWAPPPEPIDEDTRLASLRALGMLDSGPEERFDRLTRIAGALFDVPTALVSLVDADRQWFKSRYGLEATETPREMAFCGHAILSGEALVVEDAKADDRFGHNPLVTGPPHVRFYAGAPLTLDDGSRVGTLCLIDSRPRSISQTQVELLRDLADLVQYELQVGPLGDSDGTRRAGSAPARS